MPSGMQTQLCDSAVKMITSYFFIQLACPLDKQWGNSMEYVGKKSLSWYSR